MANRIAVSADTRATTTSTSASIAKRKKGFIVGRTLAYHSSLHKLTALGAQCTSSSPGEVSGVSNFCATGGGMSAALNCPGSFPAMAVLMKFIQIGSAAWAPVSLAPNVFFSSNPIHTPQVIVGEKPTNHASVKSLVVPVFPPVGKGSFAAATPVPCNTTS